MELHISYFALFILFHRTEFLVTASCDGHIKFWKKQDEGVEFVKHFKAHMGEMLLYQ